MEKHKVQKQFVDNIGTIINYLDHESMGTVRISAEGKSISEIIEIKTAFKPMRKKSVKVFQEAKKYVKDTYGRKAPAIELPEELKQQVQEQLVVVTEHLKQMHAEAHRLEEVVSEALREIKEIISRKNIGNVIDIPQYDGSRPDERLEALLICAEILSHIVETGESFEPTKEKVDRIEEYFAKKDRVRNKTDKVNVTDSLSYIQQSAQYADIDETYYRLKSMRKYYIDEKIVAFLHEIDLVNEVFTTPTKRHDELFSINRFAVQLVRETDTAPTFFTGTLESAEEYIAKQFQ